MASDERIGLDAPVHGLLDSKTVESRDKGVALPR